MQAGRRIFGVVALVSYLVMGAMMYFTVMPGTNGAWPPDFHLRGYGMAEIEPFLAAISDEARATYGAILLFWDRVFIVAFAIWMTLTGWCGGWLRFVVAVLALLYFVIDLAENVAIYRIIAGFWSDPALVSAASSLTMAKFASLYLCGLVLVWHKRRMRA